MPSERDLGVVVDIVTAARQILHFVEGMDLGEFRRDPKTSSAVILQLLIVGEASKRLSDEFHEEHREIPWSDLAGDETTLSHSRARLGRLATPEGVGQPGLVSGAGGALRR